VREWPLDEFRMDLYKVKKGSASWNLGLSLANVGLAYSEDDPELFGEPVWSLNEAGKELLRVLDEQYSIYKSRCED